MTDETIAFTAAARGFHAYKTTWKPIKGKILTRHHKGDNPYDIFSMKVCKFDVTTQIVGHFRAVGSFFIVRRGKAGWS